MDIFLKEAIEYAKNGWFVVPDHSVTSNGKCTCSDIACKTIGKHPRIERDSPHAFWRRVGSRNEDMIREWWGLWPESNVAICCGQHSGIVAIDIDPRNGGLDSLLSIEKSHGTIINTVKSQTGGNGMHLLFKHPGKEIIRNRIGLFPGIDVKADGGRIVAPPSKHYSGKTYKWISAPGSVSLSPLPNWLYLAIQTQDGTGTRKKVKNNSEEEDRLKSIQKEPPRYAIVSDTKYKSGW